MKTSIIALALLMSCGSAHAANMQDDPTFQKLIATAGACELERVSTLGGFSDHNSDQAIAWMSADMPKSPCYTEFNAWVKRHL